MSSSNDVTTSTGTNSSEHFTGRVKWFNNKAGYGFITITNGSRLGSDVFVHHSSINVSNQQYKYLVQGEYVELDLITTQNSNHEFQANNVCGINLGKLMCETRHEFKVSRNNYKNTMNTDSQNVEEQTSSHENVIDVLTPRQKRVPSSRPKARGQGPKNATQSEWTIVDGKSSQKTSTGRGRGRPPRTTNTSIEVNL